MRHAADLGLGGLSKEVEAMKKAVMPPEGITTVGDLAKRMRLGLAGPQSELGKSLRGLADKLRVDLPAAAFSGVEVPRPDLSALASVELGPSAEARAAWEIQAEVASLREVTATMAATVAAIADIANDLKPALIDYAQGAQRAATVLTRLTWALVALTAVIAVLTGVLVFGGP